MKTKFRKTTITEHGLDTKSLVVFFGIIHPSLFPPPSTSVHLFLPPPGRNDFRSRSLRRTGVLRCIDTLKLPPYKILETLYVQEEITLKGHLRLVQKD